jgi:hypothetical protein
VSLTVGSFIIVLPTRGEPTDLDDCQGDCHAPTCQARNDKKVSEDKHCPADSINHKTIHLSGVEQDGEMLDATYYSSNDLEQLMR